MNARILLIVILTAGLLSACAAPAAPESRPITLDGLECPSELCTPPQGEPFDQVSAPTAREAAAFAPLGQGATLETLLAAVGKPDWVTGSGLIILVYVLEDGSAVLAGFAGPDDLVYLTHRLANGSSEEWYPGK